MSADSFDWGRGNDAIVAREQPAVAVYTNMEGAVVIRREAGPYDDDDPFIVVQPEFAERVAAAILAAASINKIIVDAEPLALPAPATTSTGAAAVRSRRYRARRNGVTRDANSVTPSVTRDADRDAPRLPMEAPTG